MNKSLGLTMTDKITGVTGVVIAVTEYLTGCNQLLIQPPAGDSGVYVDCIWIDEQRLDNIATRKRVTLENEKTPGFGPQAPKIKQH